MSLWGNLAYRLQAIITQKNNKKARTHKSSQTNYRMVELNIKSIPDAKFVI